MIAAVCVRQEPDGGLSPFDASALEAALRLPGAETVIVSMGPPSAERFLRELTRLGAARAILLSDPAFAGSDTLATAYALSLVLRRLAPDVILCGRQTLIGDTGQTPPMLAELLGASFVPQVLELTRVTVRTRTGERPLRVPAVLAMERTYALRLPSIFSRPGAVEIVSAADAGAELSRCGLAGSPTRVAATAENETGLRKCRFLPKEDFFRVSEEAKTRKPAAFSPTESAEKLPKLLSVGDAPRIFADAVAERVIPVPVSDVQTLTAVLRAEDPDAVLFGTDPASRELAARTAARLRLGLCADCTALETDGSTLFMVRPARSGSVLAKIYSLTRPAMATVRTVQSGADVILTAGWGARDALAKTKRLALTLGAELCASRRMVDQGILPYEMQVGLTGRTVAPSVYVAVGVSGAVHHLVGMRASGTVLAVNPDPDAPIFRYADYGFLCRAEELPEE